MKFTSLAVRYCMLLSAVTSAAAAESIPWDNLASRLSSKDILTPGNVEAFFNECYGIFHDDPVFFRVGSTEVKEGSNWQLLDKPSGLCMDTLSCAFDQCTLPASFVDAALNNPGAVAPQNVSKFLANLADDEFNIPLYVVQPRSVADVVQAIKFAKEHGIPITVKTSGHHYSGASMRRGTLLINMRTNFPPYSIDETADDGSDASSLIQECDPSSPPGDDDTSFLGNACRLALARDKTGIVRVGGGEVWDQVLRSVLAYNDDPANVDGNKYHALTGNAGSVSAAGGWLASGGNSAVRGTRTWGYGVDQVLQMEMVLPSGEHVRFGPAEWEADPEYLYPKTTAVGGFCNSNPIADEAEWVWTECNVVNFADLWMAARGGGGGTWGIVTSLVYQLHARPEGGTVSMKFIPLPEFGVDPSDSSAVWEPILKDESMTKVLDEAVEDFKLDFYHNPSVLGVSEEDSNACGCDWTTYPHFAIVSSPQPEATCMGKKAAEAWAGAWNYYVIKGRGQDMLLGANFTESQIVQLGGWAVSDSWVERFAHTNITQAEMGALVIDDYTRLNIANEGEPGFRPGHVRDGPRPYVEKYTEKDGRFTTFNIPADILLENRNVFVPFLVELNKLGLPHYALGGALSKSHDQMTSIPQNRRDSGIYVHWPIEFFGVVGVLEMLFGNVDVSDGIFPGYVGHNHFVNYGPLKEDWTKPCPLSRTEEEKKELCISKQEAVWGTVLLERLEKIKAEVDPEYLMTCETGVGFEKEPDSSSLPPAGSVSSSDQPAPAPTAPVVADPASPVSTSSETASVPVADPTPPASADSPTSKPSTTTAAPTAEPSSSPPALAVTGTAVLVLASSIVTMI